MGGPNAVGSRGSHGLSPVVGGPQDLEFHQHLTEFLLHMQVVGDTGTVCEPHSQTAEKLRAGCCIRRLDALPPRGRSRLQISRAFGPPPSTNTRSQGTTTSSKIAMQSISSNRLDNG